MPLAGFRSIRHLLGLAFLLAGAVESSQATSSTAHFYPQDAFPVPISRKAELQTLLDEHKSIRLESGDYQKGNALASILIKSGYRIYGLASSLPDLRMDPGTENAVISGVHAAIIFPGGSTAVTRHNLFRRVTYSSVKVDNARVEDNLFLDLSWASMDVDTRQGGWFKNNRMIRFGAQVDAHPDNPVLRFRGDAGRGSGGNVFLGPTFLGTPANYFDNQYSLTLVGFSDEGYSTEGYAGVETGPMGLFTLWESNGLVKSGRPVITDADQAVLYGSELATYAQPAAVSGPHQKASLYLNYSVPPEQVQFQAEGFRVTGMDAGGEIEKKVIVDGVARPQSLSGSQAEQVRSMLMADRGGRWEPPVFAPVPDPAGPGWDKDRAGKPSSSAYIQGLIDKNGIALLPAGVYYIDKPIVLGRRGKGLIGAGMDSTVLMAKSPDADIIVMDSIPLGSADEPGLTLADITLQGGRNGVSQTWRGGKNLQFYDAILSHVTFRDMGEAGLRFSNIYAWDNDLLDDLNFVNCPSGFKQLTSTLTGVTDATPTLNYMDKVTFYHCRFQGCGKALDMVSGRACNDNWFVNCRFEDNSEYVWRANYSELFFVNCDLVNNGGSPVIHNGGFLYLIGSRFVAGPRAPGSFLDGFSNLSIAESEFSGGAGTSVLPLRDPEFMAQALTNPDNRRHYDNMRCNFFNSASQVPVGRYRNGLLFNNDFRMDPNLAKEWAYLDTSKLTVLMPAPAAPKAQLLAGSVFPAILSSGGGTRIIPSRRGLSGPRWLGLRVVRNSDHMLELIPEAGSDEEGPLSAGPSERLAGRLPDAVALYNLAGMRMQERKPAMAGAARSIRFEGVPAGAYFLSLRYGDAVRIRAAVVR